MLRALPPLIEPDTWVLAFHRTTTYRWLRWIAIGPYKHVSAFAWVRPYGMWVYYDVRLIGTQLILLPDSQQATAWLTSQTADADLVNFRRLNCGGKNYHLAPFSCVSAVKHLIGLRSGALLPTTLFDHCLRHGGELIHGQRPAEPDDQPGAIASAGAGQG